jgi:RimJ/RimL family protein N-acetyltransferase
VDPLIESRPTNLTSERLLLRSWTAADVEPMHTMSTDPEVMRFFPRPMTGEEVRAFVTRQAARLAGGRPGLYVLERLADRRFLGFVGLAEPRFEAAFTPCVEVGWRLVRDAWGHGYATEGARAVLAHGFGTLGLEEVVSFTAVPNEPSQAVMRRLGMHTDPADDFDHPALEEGHWLRRHVLYRLTAAQWFAQATGHDAGRQPRTGRSVVRPRG